jgi:hypothetical protein
MNKHETKGRFPQIPLDRKQRGPRYGKECGSARAALTEMDQERRVHGQNGRDIFVVMKGV